MNSQRLRFIVPSLDVGGTEIHLSSVLPRLADKGWVIDLFVLSGNLPLLKCFEHERIQIFAPTLRFNTNIRILKYIFYKFNIIQKLFKNYQTYPQTITHFFLPEAYIVGMVIAKFSKFKGTLLMSRRSLNYYQNKYFFIRPLEKLLHRRCHLIITNSKAIQKQLINLEGVPEKKIKIIYNGVKEILFDQKDKAILKKEMGYRSSQLIITSLANLKILKGQQDLIEGLFLIEKYLPKDWKLLLIGENRGTETLLKNLTEKYNFQKNIEFINNCTHPFEYLKISDIGILPSHEEGFSNALIEMMAANIPVIATNVGGNKEAVKNEWNGLLVESESPSQIGDALLKLALDAKTRKIYGERSYKRYKENFTLEKCVNTYEKLYKSLL